MVEQNNTGFSESFILGLIAAVGGLIGLVFASLRKSRCGNISCCFGCFKCQREVLTHAELQLEPPSPKL
tara:strand:+ start:370 stop:576 length:207 start_codon:yes stop_codon:yes gene_type:complete